MPQNVVDADIWTVTVVTAADGDSVNGASRLLTAQDLADRSLFIYNRTIGAAGSAVWHTPMNESPGYAQFAWQIPVAGRGGRWQQTAVGGVADFCWWQIVVPPTGRIITLEVQVDGNLGSGGVHAGLPGTMPTIELWRQDQVGAASAQVATATDPSLNVPAYETAHPIAITGLTEDCDPDVTWHVLVTGEGGANALANEFTAFDIRATVQAAP